MPSRSWEAEAYTSRGQDANFEWLEVFMAALPEGASVLELGCGAGQDSEAMIARGFDCTPTDGIPDIAAAAEKRLGLPVAVLKFGDLDAVERYRGIWANACLLHVPRAELPAVLGRIYAALQPGGVFYASYKAGSAEGRDQFDRYYNYPSQDWLLETCRLEPWGDIIIKQSMGGGYDQKPTAWLHVLAKK